jgi:hypothetical protein
LEVGIKAPLPVGLCPKLQTIMSVLKVSDFGEFWISDFQVRDSQSVKTMHTLEIQKYLKYEKDSGCKHFG